MSDLTHLNQQFAIPGTLEFKQAESGQLYVEVTNPHATATIALQGAQVMEWAPQGQPPVIWTSPQAKLTSGKSLRGGVPVCWPWFGAHASEADFPAHGFARTRPWQVVGTKALDDGRTELLFQLPADQQPQQWWPHRTELHYRITVGETLELELVTANRGDEPLTLGQALHTYFNVGDVRSIRVEGLAGRDYLDKVEGLQRKTQQGDVDFIGETDRIYLDSEDECVIRDPQLARAIHITKRGSRSTVVWNPWIEKAAAMGDLGENGYLNMVCVESANAAADVVALPPGTEHTLWVNYRVES